MKDKFILDSSIWIDLHRDQPAVRAVVDPMIAHNQVCLVDVIVAEVVRGATSRRDYSTLLAAFSDFVWLSTQWERVAELAFQVGRAGFQPPLIDLYIAQCAIETKRTVVTRDRHFRQLSTVTPLRVIMV